MNIPPRAMIIIRISWKYHQEYGGHLQFLNKTCPLNSHKRFACEICELLNIRHSITQLSHRHRLKLAMSKNKKTVPSNFTVYI